MTRRHDQSSAISRLLLTQGGVLLGVALVAIGLWLWGRSGIWAESAQRVDVALWSIRAFAAASIAGGQAVFAWLVVPGLVGRASRGVFEQSVTLVSTLVVALTGVCGIALSAAAGWS